MLTPTQLEILRELAPMELGIGWPYAEKKPWEPSECQRLEQMGLLRRRRGGAYQITKQGRKLARQK